MLTLYRTPIVLGSSPGARVCFVKVQPKYDHPRGTWPAIENADDPDKMPVGEYELIMTRMASSQRPALWLPDTELFGHDANFARQLKGCFAWGEQLTSRGRVFESRKARDDIFEALGGWVEGKRVPFRCVELGELPATRYEVIDFETPLQVWAGQSRTPSVGERWTRLADGGLMVEREVKE